MSDVRWIELMTLGVALRDQVPLVHGRDFKAGLEMALLRALIAGTTTLNRHILWHRSSAGEIGWFKPDAIGLKRITIASDAGLTMHSRTA